MDKDDLLILICAGIILLCFLGCAIGFNAYKCKSKAVMQELEWSYGPIQGCMVKQENGKWIDYDRLRYMDK